MRISGTRLTLIHSQHADRQLEPDIPPHARPAPPTTHTHAHSRPHSLMHSLRIFFFRLFHVRLQWCGISCSLSRIRILSESGIVLKFLVSFLHLSFITYFLFFISFVFASLSLLNIFFPVASLLSYQFLIFFRIDLNLLTSFLHASFT